MSIFKRFTSKSEPVRTAAAPPGSPFTRSSGRQGSSGMPSAGPARREAMMANQPRPRSGTDPQTCMEVYKSHWSQASVIINRNNGEQNPSPVKRSPNEEVEAVTRYLDQMLLLAMEEEAQDGGHGPILEYTLMEDILEKLLLWSSRHPEHADRLKLHQLKVYELLICQARQTWVIHKPVIRPLLKLLSACKEHNNQEIEAHLILILHQLCVCIMKQTQLLELLFNAASDQGPAKFLMFSLLIPYVHREGHIGQQARDALLLIMALSCRNESIGIYVAEHSDFCPVLATGLSGLYSSLPQKWENPPDDWSRITQEEIGNTPELCMFLNSLEFCNAVVQVAHPLVRDQLLNFIYNGFLVPVLGPALHQNDVLINETAEDDDDAFFDFDDDDEVSSMEEVIAATAYLDLFIRRVTESELMRTFLRFLLTEKYEDDYILDSLIQRINSNSRLCMVTLALFNTLVDLSCEDVMFQLVFKYLIPCTHVMVSQRRSVKDVDLYSKTAEKLLSLTPSCCSAEFSDSPPDDLIAPDSPSSTSTTDSFNAASSPASPSESRSQKAKRFLFGKRIKDSTQDTDIEPERSSSPDVNRLTPGVPSSTYDSKYMEYLRWSKLRLEQCASGCQCWVFPYDGEVPSPDSESGDFGLLSQPALSVIEPDPDSDGMTTAEEQSKTEARQAEVASSQPNSSTTASSVSDLGMSSTLGVVSSTPCVSSGEGRHGSYTESVTSEADSGLSSSSAQISVGENPASRSDSPLNDNFDSGEFNAFLLSLKRVQTPVEFCDNIEDSFNEIDSVISELKQMDVKLSSGRSRTLSEKRNSSHLDTSAESGISPPNSEEKSTPPSAKESHVGNTKEVGQSCTKEVVSSRSGVSAFAPVKPGIKLSGVSPIFTPTKYNLGTPNIGPFLTTILSKLETMMANSLYVNLLLTGLVTRLACYPQPLIRSFLLNHTLVFQPTVKSLVQVLSSVKHKVDCYSYTVKEFDSMMVNARRFLAWRDENHKSGGLHSRRESTASLPANSLRNNKSDNKEKRRGSTLSDLLFRRTPNKKQVKEPRLQLLGENKGFRYINRSNSPQEGSGDSIEALKTKNAVYCALVLEEFIKELSAVSQEHAVLCIEE